MRRERKLLRGQAFAVDDDDRNVVARAATKRKVEQGVDGALRILGGKHGGDFVFRDMHGQTVAAQKKSIPRVDTSVNEVQLRLIGRAKRAGDNVTAGKSPSALLVEKPAIDQFLCLGVVARNLPQCPDAVPFSPLLFLGQLWWHWGGYEAMREERRKTC